MSISSKAKSLTFGLEREWFCGDSIFQRETERIFSQHWLCLGRVEDFDRVAQATPPTGYDVTGKSHSQESTYVKRDSSATDSYLSVSVGTDNLIIVRDRNGNLTAFHNVCRHRGTRLLDQACGRLKNSCIMCPYHAWTYDLQGQLIGVPNMQDVPEFDTAEFSLHRVGCVNWCGFIMLNLTRPDNDFEEAFAPILHRFKPWNLQDLKLGHTLEYNVAANWKLLFQNYSECYHCPTVHPALNRLTPYKSATNDLTEGAILGGPMSLADGFETVSSDGKKIAEPFPGLNSTQRRSVYYYTVFPSMFISAHPDYVMVHQIERISNSRSKIKCHFLIEPTTSDENLARAVNQWDEVNRQDWHVCELTQKGVESSAYVPGPYSNLETILMAFDRHYRQVMNG
jgi:Rieske 2Fe-2S family protein